MLTDFMATPIQNTITRPVQKHAIEVGPFAKGRLRGTRDTLTTELNASKLTVAEKALVFEKIAAVDAKFTLLEVHFQSNPHKGGSNTSVTVTEL